MRKRKLDLASKLRREKYLVIATKEVQKLKGHTEAYIEAVIYGKYKHSLNIDDCNEIIRSVL